MFTIDNDIEMEGHSVHQHTFQHNLVDTLAAYHVSYLTTFRSPRLDVNSIIIQIRI